ncbi:hypothetical protein [Cupriavidus sp. RAF12]|uniref:hypothetical protein n=1 Tax=Cupriavidus sp. RAF12 TaxID=3233050 RepID=UPI003F938CCB
MNTQATPNAPDTATVAVLDALNSATGALAADAPERAAMQQMATALKTRLQ